MNSNYHTIPEILRGVDFSINQVDFINVGVKDSLTAVAYGQGPNFLVVFLILILFYAIPAYFLHRCRTAES